MHENLVRGLIDMKVNMLLTKAKKCSKTHVQSSITFLLNTAFIRQELNEVLYIKILSLKAKYLISHYMVLGNP